MIWWDLDDDAGLEVGVLETDGGLELVALENGDGFVWAWRDESGRVLGFPDAIDG